jgi:N6-adenosine-specific RNA methylase IME4
VCAADDCVCFMWTTLQHLAIAIDVLRRRGFAYKSSYAWGKDKIGLGYWSREKHEILLIGVKGKVDCPAPGKQWDSLIIAPRDEHSAKPECFLEMIEQYFPTLPKIELNRRGPAREGWKAWGNEAGTLSLLPASLGIQYANTTEGDGS